MAFVYEIIGGADAASFTIDPNTGVWQNSATLNGGSYFFDVRAKEDAGNGFFRYSNTINITAVVGP